MSNFSYKDSNNGLGEIRPNSFGEFIGQKHIVEELSIYIKASNNRSDTLEHILFYGPPGLGKTTISKIIASEVNSNLVSVSGPSLEKIGDLAAILSSLKENDILFIDEIHRLPMFIEETLYSVMEDYVLDIIIGNGAETRIINLNIANFTLVGATTKLGNLSSPLRDRFGAIFKLEYYSSDELEIIISRIASIFKIVIDDQSKTLIAKASRGTPRIAINLFKRIRDYAEILNDSIIDLDLTKNTLKKLNININGLNDIDIKYLNKILIDFNGGPVGLDTISIALGEDSKTIEDVIEPFLIKKGLLKRTLRGRIITDKGIEVINN